MSWLIGKSGASHAADPGSILGKVDEMAKKIDRFTTYVCFSYGCAGVVKLDELKVVFFFSSGVESVCHYFFSSFNFCIT